MTSVRQTFWQCPLDFSGCHLLCHTSQPVEEWKIWNDIQCLDWSFQPQDLNVLKKVVVEGLKSDLLENLLILWSDYGPHLFLDICGAYSKPFQIVYMLYLKLKVMQKIFRYSKVFTDSFYVSMIFTTPLYCSLCL